GETEGYHVAGGQVGERIECFDGHVKGGAGSGNVGQDDLEMISGRGQDCDGGRARRAADGRLGGNVLGAGGAQRNVERVNALVGGCEGVVGGQSGRRVRAA